MYLKKERIKKELTQEKLAELSNITRSQVSKIENGVSQPSVKTAKAIAEALDIDWIKFFDKEGE